MDLLLAAVLALCTCKALVPLVEELSASHEARTIISRMSGVSDATDDPARMRLLRAAQAYNLALGGTGAHTDNEGRHGGNEGTDDVLSLATAPDECVTPYKEQLATDDAPICWVEVPAAGIALPVWRTTTDEVLAQGVGHLASSSLPVGGMPSRCVLAAHSGMEQASMFDRLDEVARGDVVILHTLGDAYWYEVCEIQTVTPAEADRICRLQPDEDLCTLVTCTPYGVNSHRLLVHARRCVARTSRPQGRSAVSYVTDRRSAPPLALVGTLAAIGVVAARRRRTARRPRRPTETLRAPGGAPPSVPRTGRPRADRGFLPRMGVALGALLCLGAALIACRLRLDTDAYARVAERVVYDRASDAEGSGPMPAIDWKVLHDINEDVAAWVEVEGTDIGLPVLAPSDADMVYYLRHDIWRQPSLTGVPFLDHRGTADGTHRIAYGHHLSSGGQFSQLQHAYEPDVFRGLGACHWSTPERGMRELLPLCALTVDQWYGPIQRFAFADASELHAWLRTVCRDATARSAGWERLCDEADSALTLVTCSSELSNQPWRTLVVFVAARSP